MTITLSKSVEEKLAALPQEAIENALLRLVEEHGHNKKKALADALQEGLDDIEAGRITRISSDSDMDHFFQSSRKRVLEKVAKNHA